MKIILIFCLCAHLAVATLPTNLLSSLGGILGGGSSASASSEGSSSGGFGGAGQRVLGDVLGVKISLLTALQNTVTGGSQTIDLESSSAGEVVDGTGSGLGVSGSSSGSSQSFSAGSGFSQMVGIGESSGGYSGGNAGYVYNRPASSGSGYAANGGYSYERPPPVESYSSSSSGSSSEFSSGSGSVESGNFGSISSSSATQSGTAGLTSENSSGGIGGIVGSLVQIPIQLLTAYQSGINRGFDSVSSGLNVLQSVLSSAGGGHRTSDSSSDFESNTLRRRL